ncbi:DDB1- and CUL4-associated factor 1-like [Ylistrum balloti]|uniref:DDB1- and CUL4-associated factor 1-like n=1 Tax=Ylistrum balloti TaxID=509963 RepID=UPI002905CC80|nr:DDB1- and CUL4-associated factor 1-like [Ylistrum balloti]
MAALDSMAELTGLLEQWGREQATATCPIHILTRISELMEKETESYYKMDPDPFDDRHPGRANPTCALGHLMKALFKNDDFMNKLVSQHLMGSRDHQYDLQAAACRLLLALLPGLEPSIVFQETEGLVRRLLHWAETSDDPLRSYAIGVLAGAMEIHDVAANFKDVNSGHKLVSLMLRRLHELKAQMEQENKEQICKQDENHRYFSMFDVHKADSTPDKTERGCSSAKKKNSPGKSGCDLTNIKDNYTSNNLPKDLNMPVNLISSMPDSPLNDNSYGKQELIMPLNPSHSSTPVKQDNSCGQIDLDKPINPSDFSTTVKSTSDSNQIHQDDLKFVKPNCQSTEKLVKDGSSPEKASTQELQDSREASPIKSGQKKSYRQMAMKRALSPSYYSEEIYRFTRTKTREDSVGEFSNSSWAEMEPYVIGTFCLSPLSTAMKQRLILQYLTPMGEYQELISDAFEHNAVDLIFYYIDLKCNKDIRLAFEALKYLATLMCHKKFAIEFLQMSGLQRLLNVYRPSIAATGVSLCLYYLSYFEDVLERVCLLPEHVLSHLVSYLLWLMECSHDSSRCHAAMFFGMAFPFRVILDLFDQKDGLRRLFNVVSTLEILNVETRRDSLNEDQIFTMRQSARHVSLAMKRYFEAHLAHKIDEIRRSHARNDGSSPVQENPAYKAIKLSPELVQENVELMMELMPVRAHWAPEATFHKLGGIQLLSQLIAMAPSWNNYPGKPEMIRNALDVINVCTVTPKSQLALLDSVPMLENHRIHAISVLIGLAEGDVLSDPEVQKSALNVIINCVCGPVERLGGGVGRYMGTGAKKKINLKMGEDVLSRMWNGVRINNGIMVLLKLLSVKTPITDADSLRALACKALVGLSRSETVRQIIGKLPLFNNGQLQMLIKEPVLQDRRQEFVKFCKYANNLLERVSGKHSHANFDASLDEIRRADIVAQTKIIFQERELLQLMYSHLVSQGLHEAASALQKEANLPVFSSTPQLHSTSPHFFSTPHHTPKLGRPICPPNNQSASNSQVTQPISINTSYGQTENGSTSGSSAAATSGHIRFTIGRPSHPSPSNITYSKLQSTRCRFNREKEGGLGSPALRNRGNVGKATGEFENSLDKIVTEYLRKQHALCRNPVSTCPQMSLFQPHRCPEPRGKRSAPANFTSRYFNSQIQPRFGGLEGASANHKFIYSRFRPIKTFKDGEDNLGFTCCAFLPTQQHLILGTYTGDLKLFNVVSDEEPVSFSAHMSPITNCQPSRDGKLILTSFEVEWESMHGSCLWSYGDILDSKYSFEDNYVEFSKHIEDRIIGTRDDTAHIYDVTTGRQLLKLYDSNKANNYQLNRATFNPTDDMVLNDGVLWDVRSGKSIHKFDKFNQFVSGVFHPMGLEIIINSEVWDIRTYHLLHTVPSLDQCQIHFNHNGNIMYAIQIDQEPDAAEEKVRSPYGSTFRTFDSKDYSSIATIDVKSGSIADLCCDKADCFLAVVENQDFTDETATKESVCKLYEIGKLRDAEDDQPEEEEDDGMEEDDDDDEDDILNMDDSLDDSNDSFDGEGDDDDGDDNGENDDDDDDDEDISISDVDDEDDLDDDILFQLV